MERLHTTVVQLEESKRFIVEGDVAHLRLALILLDNAVEVMMHRVVESELVHAGMYANMLKNFGTRPLDEEGSRLRNKIAEHTIPDKEQKQIRRYFPAKLKFLSENRNRMSKTIARALKHLHSYRNETQHLDKIRKESMLPAVLILLDIALDLLVELTPGMVMWSSDDDLSWRKKYGFGEKLVEAEVLRRRIAAKLREGLPLDLPGIRTSLIGHLTDRLGAMENELDFVAQHSRVGPDRELILKDVQFWHSKHSGKLPKEAAFDTYVPQFNLACMPRWRGQVTSLSTVDDKSEMFDVFGTIEDDFEPLETMIDDAVSSIDAAIQIQIDIARGK